MSSRQYLIDGLQYANWSEDIFLQMRTASVDAVHATISYHGNFRDMITDIEAWNQRFIEHSRYIMHGKFAEDIDSARDSQRTAIFFGLQNPSPVEDDIGLIEVMHTLGVRFMQLSYNNQSLLATGCFEKFDTGITLMGKEVIAEMNRVGLVVDMSHSSERSTLEAIDISTRPIALTHANPQSWHSARRNKSDKLLRALAESGGILGFSCYPHHLKDGSKCSLASFCHMVCDTAELMGIDRIAIGSDLCQDQPDSAVQWMRNGRWTKKLHYGEGSAQQAGFPDMLDWFASNEDFHQISQGLLACGMSSEEMQKVMGNNWYRFFQQSFVPQNGYNSI